MLTLEHVDIALSGQPIINDVSLHLDKGQIGCLLGPSGCGKTTLLRAIAGFERVNDGRITVVDKLVSDKRQHLPVQDRQLGIVFQDFALFPHQTVAQNIAFGLQHPDSPSAQARVAELLQLIQLTSYADSYPHALSGGQQQRVAIARALANRPAVLLLDEPFSALDPSLRETLSQDIKSILKHEGVTALFVTHDQSEAFMLADHIILLNAGRVEQQGSAFALYHTPYNPFVAEFIGDGVLLPCTLDEDNPNQIMTAFGSISLPAPLSTPPTPDSVPNQVLLRPDDVILAASNNQQQTNTLTEAIVVGSRFNGSTTTLRLMREGQCIQCVVPSHQQVEEGATVTIGFELKHRILF